MSNLGEPDIDDRGIDTNENTLAFDASTLMALFAESTLSETEAIGKAVARRGER